MLQEGLLPGVRVHGDVDFEACEPLPPSALEPVRAVGVEHGIAALLIVPAVIRALDGERVACRVGVYAQADRHEGQLDALGAAVQRQHSQRQQQNQRFFHEDFSFRRMIRLSARHSAMAAAATG